MRKAPCENQNHEIQLTLKNVHKIVKKYTSNDTQKEFFQNIFPQDIFVKKSISREVKYPVKSTIGYIMNKETDKYKDDFLISELMCILDAIDNDNVDKFQDYLKYVRGLLNRKVCEEIKNIIINDPYLPFSKKKVLGSVQFEGISIKNHNRFIIEMLALAISKGQQAPMHRTSFIEGIFDISICTSANKHNSDLLKDASIFLNSILREGARGKMGDRVILDLAKQGNAFGCFEAANMEATGHVVGKPRFDKCYEYLSKAMEKGHALSIWSIGYIHYSTIYDNLSEDVPYKHDFNLAMKFFQEAAELDCAAAYNSIGKAYLEGNVPGTDGPDLVKAKFYFEQAIERDYIFAYNNLARLFEIEAEANSSAQLKSVAMEKASQNLKISADKGDSWAANKYGLILYNKAFSEEKKVVNHRDRKAIRSDYKKKALDYFMKSIESPASNKTKYAYFNIAVKYYLHGDPDLSMKSDPDAAIKYLEIAADQSDGTNGVAEALVELIKIYCNIYNGFSTSKEKGEMKIKINEHYDTLLRSTSYNNDLKNKLKPYMKTIRSIYKISGKRSISK